MARQSTAEPAPLQSPASTFILIAFAVIAAVLRFQAAKGDFWLDEIWTWYLVLPLHSMAEVFRLHSDNNHYLNTAWFYLLGDRSNWRLYRLPAIAAGIGTVAGLAIIGGRRSRFQQVVLPAMAALSFPLVLYSSEARGYGLATFFTVACLDQMEQQLARPAWQHCLLFAAAAMLGLLSHLTFLIPYCGIVAWAALGLWQKRPISLRKFAPTAMACVAPLALLAWLFLVDLSDLQIGGGPTYSATRLLVDTVTSAYGLPGSAVIAAVLGIVTAVAVGLLITRSPAFRSGDWVLYATSLCLAPLLVVCLRGSALIYPRYLVVCQPIFLMLLAEAVDTLRTWPAGRAAAWTLAGLFCIGNGLAVSGLLKDGRGHYLAATQYLAARTEDREITVSSDQYFRATLTFLYYQRFLPPGKSIRVIEDDRNEAAQWRLLERQDGDNIPADRIHSSDGTRYQLARTFPYSSRFSGFTWYLYRRVPAD